MHCCFCKKHCFFYDYIVKYLRVICYDRQIHKITENEKRKNNGEGKEYSTILMAEDY